VEARRVHHSGRVEVNAGTAGSRRLNPENQTRKRPFTDADKTESARTGHIIERRKKRTQAREGTVRTHGIGVVVGLIECGGIKRG